VIQIHGKAMQVLQGRSEPPRHSKQPSQPSSHPPSLTPPRDMSRLVMAYNRLVRAHKQQEQDWEGGNFMEASPWQESNLQGQHDTCAAALWRQQELS